MPENREPDIAPIGDSTIALSPLVRVWQRFTATFPGEPSVTIEIEMIERRPEVRMIAVTSDSTDLTDTNSRLPLRSKLVPAAVKAASMTTLYGGLPLEQLLALPAEETVHLFTTRQPVAAKLPQHEDRYDGAAKGTRVRRPGRPRHVTPAEELQRVANDFNETKSISDVRIRHSYSRSTAYRRVQEARDAGLLDE